MKNFNKSTVTIFTFTN